MPELPDATRRHPITLPDGTTHQGTVYLKPAIDHPNWEIGAFSYASDFDPPEDWASRLAPYLYPGAPDRLVIGRYCQIAHGVRFVTASANHARDGISAFPFPVFDPATMRDYTPDTRDIVIGNDVWLGMGATVCPGTRIGNGVIVGTRAVVSGKVPDYAVVTGNPARVQRLRFLPDEIARLNRLAWWDWSSDRVAAAQALIQGGDVAALEGFADGARSGGDGAGG